MSPAQDLPTASTPSALEPPDPWREDDPWIGRTPSRLLIWFGVVLIVASMAAAALVLWEMRSDAIDKAQIDLRRLALSQSQETMAALKGADLALLSVISDLASNPK
ncbi:MAG: hypothetical protein JO128_22610, partial [Alphaproteobacteria bacterium]|nr:hypothetical protein [Alphaproteobacteria bacterium]